MELLKNYKVVISIVLIVLVLVVIRSAGVNHFKSDAKKWAEPSFRQSNTLTVDQAKLLRGNNLAINLDKDLTSISGIPGDIQNISADSILSKEHLSTILNHDGPVLLLSSDPGLSARIWMVLSQMGRKNIYILTSSTDNEVLKYKFRPESMPDTNL
jgi:rhodanese-related sulfurtransferase